MESAVGLVLTTRQLGESRMKTLSKDVALNASFGDEADNSATQSEGGAYGKVWCGTIAQLDREVE